MTTTLVLVRHGETDWNREHRFQGHADNPLNEEGRTQSRDVAERLVAERLLALYTSPLRRALETATIVGERLGLDIHVSEPMREIDVCSWEGLTLDEVRARFPTNEKLAWSAGWDGGETYAELDDRVVAGLLQLAAAHDSEHVVVVTHGGPIRADRRVAWTVLRRGAPPLRAARQLRGRPGRRRGRRRGATGMTDSWTTTRTTTGVALHAGLRRTQSAEAPPRHDDGVETGLRTGIFGVE